MNFELQGIREETVLFCFIQLTIPSLENTEEYHLKRQLRTDLTSKSESSK
jgi:hypothetical protein